MPRSDGGIAMARTEWQAEPCTETTCEQCEERFTPKSRNGVKVRFCCPKCSQDWHNGQRLKGAALLKMRKMTVQRRASPRKTLIDLATIPEAARPALLAEAARRLGLSEEG